MTNIQHSAEESNAVLTANNNRNNMAFTASVPDGNVFGSSGEELQHQLYEADKCNAKIHYLSRSVAKEHGVIPSAILTGFAYKLRHHKKNQWNGRWWYYDPIEVLRTHRWPYLSDGCLCENINYLCSQGLLIKGCNNKLSLDRTSWYAMDDDVRNAVLSDLVWYDVSVAKRFKDIFPALIYHNVRFHVREALKNDPECLVPYHKLNQARLARELPMSASTAKRCVKQLVDAGLFVRHPSKRNLYTLADASQYRVIGSGTNANGSTANAIGSSTDGSTANANRSTANAIGSGVNAIGSTANDNTLYETSRKLVRNHSQTGACVMDENSSSDDKRNDAFFVDHQYVTDDVGSFPLRGKEETDVPSISLYLASLPTTFNQLVYQTNIGMTTRQTINQEYCEMLESNYQEVCSTFIDEQLDAGTITEFWNNRDLDSIVQWLNKPFADRIMEDIDGWHELPVSKEHLWQLLYYPMLEIMVRAFSADEVRSGKHHHTFPDQRSSVWRAYCTLRNKLRNEPNFTAEHKCAQVKESIAEYNNGGLILSDKEVWRNVVQPQASAFKKLTAVFNANPHLSAGQVLAVLREALDVACLEDECEDFDKYWASRQSRDLCKFVNLLPKIIGELDMFEVCPVHALT